MQPRIELIAGKKLIGMRIEMSFAENKTMELWRNFMPRRKEILNNVSTKLISMQLYGASFDASDLHTTFEKWAVVEVTDFNTIPSNMESYFLTGGLYAVFHYKGLDSNTNIFRYIFGRWLPNSGYVIDNRAHFEILGDKYRNNDPNSEEDIWIPIRAKK
jgi:AraC family transcriptional regulator